MGGNGVKSSDFYQVLGLEKGCTEAELKNAYKKLALVRTFIFEIFSQMNLLLE